MNLVIVWAVRIWLSRLRKENPMAFQAVVFLATRVFWLAALVVKEWGLITGIVKQIIKVLAGLASFTPTRKDDDIVTQIDDLFNRIQDKIYKGAELIVSWYGSWGRITGG